MKDFLHRLQIKMSRFMYDRNGKDELFYACYILGLAVFVLGLLTGQLWLCLLAFAILGYCFFRLFSRKLIKRQNENVRYLRKIEKIKKKFRALKEHGKHK
ncbi:MAG: hypothetical protein K6G12_11045 [Lachnospiraceae bacterium]|nr:hypothetical protein [Lachnospiraceae bacterium]